MESDTNDIFDGITTRVRFTLMTLNFGGSMRTANLLLPPLHMDRNSYWCSNGMHLVQHVHFQM